MVLHQPWLRSAVHTAAPAHHASTPAALTDAARCAPVLAFENMTTSSDSSSTGKCPFTAAMTGGGLGEANVLTFAFFVAVVLVLRVLFRRLFAIAATFILSGRGGALRTR
eukprot:1413495-Prymnesium_polylepis.1